MQEDGKLQAQEKKVRKLKYSVCHRHVRKNESDSSMESNP